MPANRWCIRQATLPPFPPPSPPSSPPHQAEGVVQAAAGALGAEVVGVREQAQEADEAVQLRHTVLRRRDRRRREQEEEEEEEGAGTRDGKGEA
jgi:hypothetical protein